MASYKVVDKKVLYQINSEAIFANFKHHVAESEILYKAKSDGLNVIKVLDENIPRHCLVIMETRNETPTLLHIDIDEYLLNQLKDIESETFDWAFKALENMETKTTKEK